MNEMKHILSVDVEDYFQVEAFRHVVSMESWEGRESRVLKNTQRILECFARQNAKGTFFFVGWVAEKFPQLVKDVHAAGHEVACHSYWHRTVFSLDQDEFRKDTKRAKDVLEQISGARVLGYRAPSWSITGKSLWALNILHELGFVYDSSIYPIRHDIYGLPGAKRFPYTHQLSPNQELLEFPPTTIKLGGMELPAAGGGYLRIFPMTYTHLAFRQLQRKWKERAVVYMHPWEFDPEQPRIPDAGLRSNLRHYLNLDKMEGRVSELLRTYKFQPFREMLREGVRIGEKSFDLAGLLNPATMGVAAH
jgi:polysaccharide deacetylase family protein (PEP-CTERM system associated)